MNQYKDIFTYESTKEGDGGIIYTDCVFLRNFGDEIRAGMKFHTVMIEAKISITALQACDDEDADVEFTGSEYLQI